MQADSPGTGGSGAHAPQTSPGNAALDVEELNDDLDGQMGKTVAVVGEVEKRFDNRSFVLESGGLFDNEITVIVPQTSKGMKPDRIQEDAQLLIHGKVRKASVCRD
jgi:hypothetical protein